MSFKQTSIKTFMIRLLYYCLDPDGSNKESLSVVSSSPVAVFKMFMALSCLLCCIKHCNQAFSRRLFFFFVFLCRDPMWKAVQLGLVCFRAARQQTSEFFLTRKWLNNLNIVSPQGCGFSSRSRKKKITVVIMVEKVRGGN